VSLRFRSEVLDCLPFLEVRHPYLSEQADSNRIGSPHSFQAGMPDLQWAPSSRGDGPLLLRISVEGSQEGPERFVPLWRGVKHETWNRRSIYSAA